MINGISSITAFSSAKSFSPLIPSALVDYSEGIYELKKQKVLYRIFSSMNPKPATKISHGGTELFVKSLISPDFANKHPKITNIAYKFIPLFMPKPAPESIVGKKKLFLESALSPEQYKVFFIKTRLKYEKLLHKTGLR